MIRKYRVVILAGASFVPPFTVDTSTWISIEVVCAGIIISESGTLCFMKRKNWSEMEKAEARKLGGNPEMLPDVELFMAFAPHAWVSLNEVES